MKSKVIKKITRILLYFIGALLLLFVAFYYALRSPVFQTWAANRAGWYFSKQLGTTVRVEGVDIEFWKKIILEGVYVEDQHRDTLLYAQKIKLDIGTFDRDSQNVFINDVVLQNATVKMKQYRNDSVLNFQFIIDEFSSKDTTTRDSSKWNIAFKDIRLDNIRFTYRSERDTSHVRGINFSDIVANSVNAKISNLFFDQDTTHCTIENLTLIEKSGFVLKKLSAHASVSPVSLKLDEMEILSNNSSITANLALQYKTYRDFNHFVDSVKITSTFKKSDIEMQDVAYFSDQLYGIKKKVFLDGTVRGKVSDLKGRNIFLIVGDETSFKGNFDMTGLPDIDQTFMSFDAKELRTSKKGIESIPLPPFDEKHSISLPDNVSLFGVIKFKGNFSGFYNDFVSYGKFNTALGQISTDISLRTDSISGLPVYHGKFACADFNLGKFFESEKYIGKITMNTIIDGKGFKKENAVFSVEGTTNSLEVNGYAYKNIAMKGKLARNVFDGLLTVDDENLKLDFNGDVDFSKSPTQLNFTSDITRAYLSRLNIIKSDTLIGITAKVDVNAVGNNPDDVTGSMKLNNVVYSKGTDVFNFKDIDLSINDQSGMKTMDLNSFMADAHLNGKFKPMEVAACLNDFLANYLPSYIPRLEGPVAADNKHPKRKVLSEHLQQFGFEVQLKNTDAVTQAFFPSLKIATPATIKGNYDEQKNDFYFLSDFPAITVNDYKFNRCNVSAASEVDKLSFKANCQRLVLSDSVWIDSILLTSVMARDTLNFKLNWHNNADQKYQGDVPGYIAFSQKPKIEMKLLPSVIIIADSTWNLNTENEVVLDSSFVRVRNLEFICGKQRVKLDGNISEVKEDQMYLMLTSFSLANLNSYLKGSGFSVYGTISGNTSVSNIYGKPLLESTIDIQTLKLNNELIGDGSLVSVFDSKKDVINVKGGFRRDGGDNLKFSGDYYPYRRENSLDMEAEIHDFRLDLFNPFIKDNFENLRGVASASLKIKGTPSKMLLSGTLKANVQNVHVNYLGTDYHFNGDISVEPNAFDFSSLALFDVNNNRADIVNGKIFHDNFKKFQLDFDISASKFMALNTAEKDNSTYYGRVFATGILNVFGFLDNINLSASIKTDKAKNATGKNEYSQLFIPLSGSEEVGENGFVSFVKKDTTAKTPKYKVTTSGFTMDFKLRPTEDAQVQLIFDEKVGDIIKANGTGDIRMVVDEFGDFKMFGDYTVEEGDYLFTLKNVVNKKFRLEKGGTIHWSGNPEEADLNMSAVYELRTSLAPLFMSYEETDATRKRYPVDCIMKLTGKLLEPDIAFAIQMPLVDEFTRQKAYDKFNNSESELNKQVFSLMFINSFSAPQGQQGENTGGPGAGTVTSTEMLSNQLSNWLSQISKEFDVGVHYRPGDEVNNKDQVEVALSTQLFNDKLTIDGSVANNANGTTAGAQNTSNVVGDVKIDYKLTGDGKVRAKAYNKANEGDILNAQKGPYTQGIGIVYRKEFEHIFNRKKKTEQKK